MLESHMDHQVLHKLVESHASFSDAAIKVKDGHNKYVLNFFFFYWDCYADNII